MEEQPMETVLRFNSIEAARNAAIRCLEQRGAIFSQDRRVQIGKFGDLAGKEVGVESTQGPWWRLRLDYDPIKRAHFNAEFGKQETRVKTAFLFPGDAALIARLAVHRQPR
jgi:hypothetical protein